LSTPLTAPALRFELTSAMTPDVDIQNRFYMSFTGGSSPGDVAALASSTAAAWGTTVATLLSNNITLTNVQVTDMTTLSSPDAGYVASVVGAVSSAAVDIEEALIIKFVVNRRYRGGKPKVYLAGVPATDKLNDFEWTTGTATNFAAQWIDFIAAIKATGGLGIDLANQVNVSFYEGFTVKTGPTGRARNAANLRVTGSPPVADPLIDIITSYEVDQVIGIQKRRRGVR